LRIINDSSHWFGLLSCVFVRGFGPLLFSLVFSFFTSDRTPLYLPAAPFFLGAAFITVAFIVTALLRDKSREFGFHHKPVSFPAGSGHGDDSEPLLHPHLDNHSYNTTGNGIAITTPIKDVASVAGSSFVITLTQHASSELTLGSPSSARATTTTTTLLDSPGRTPTRGTGLTRSQSHPITLTMARNTPHRTTAPIAPVILEEENEPQS
jgi:hypothetical protein